jgi:hypothetical protein
MFLGRSTKDGLAGRKPSKTTNVLCAGKVDDKFNDQKRWIGSDFRASSTVFVNKCCHQSNIFSL